MLRIAGALAVFMLSIGNAAAGPTAPPIAWDVNIINTPTVNAVPRTVVALQEASGTMSPGDIWDKWIDASGFSKVRVMLRCTAGMPAVSFYTQPGFELLGTLDCLDATPPPSSATWDVFATEITVEAYSLSMEPWAIDLTMIGRP